MLKLFAKLILVLLVPVSVGAANYFVDPLQFYRRSTFYTPDFYDQQRYQAPGIAKNYNYSLAFVGTSMSENFSLDEIREKLGRDAVRLTMSGSSAYEQKIILDLALRSNHQVDTVIWDINYSSLSGSADAVRDKDAVFPMYLYDENVFNDFKYLLDPLVTQRTVKQILKGRRYVQADADEALENLNKWANWSRFSREITLQSFNNSVERGEFQPFEYVKEDYKFEKLRDNVDKNIFSAALSNPDIKFKYYFPPFSILEIISFKMNGTFDNFIKIRDYIFQQYSKYDNIEIFDFQASDFILELENYKDRAHHIPQMNSKMLDYMLEGEAVTSRTFYENQDKITNLCEEYFSRYSSRNYNTVNAL